MNDDVPLHVVATAGHVDHGKSALILRLTGMDPDRLAEEKRRGLTIDLGFAWTTLPSGTEIGFVDVPGHERFIRNMLAGVGPVRLLLFVVAADEGWKPQSEEHLQIVDVLGVEDAVVALTKTDLVDDARMRASEQEVRRRLAGTRLEGAPIVGCSAHTGEGIDALRASLDHMVQGAAAPEIDGRPRQFVDRVFTIRGAGTVVTGTLTGGPLVAGQEVVVLPSGQRARIRGLQTHKRSLERAVPVSRVAVNLAGTATEALERGDALVLPGQWRPVTMFEAFVQPVRGLGRAMTARGAYKVYAGAAERDARIRFFTESRGVAQGADGAFARVTLRHPLVLDWHDLFVIRESGRRETVAGGRVVDPDPPPRPGPATIDRLVAFDAASRADLPGVVLRWRRILREESLFVSTGGRPDPSVAVALGHWLASPEAVEDAASHLLSAMRAYHERHPLRPGMEIAEARDELARLDVSFADAALADALLAHLAEAGDLTRGDGTVRVPEHRISTTGSDEADQLVAAVAAGGASPPAVRDLVAGGWDLELIRAASADGRLVRISPDLVISPEIVERAQALIRDAGPEGVTVSGFRQALGTSRKYALPLLEHLDAKGLTRRVGDVRISR